MWDEKDLIELRMILYSRWNEQWRVQTGSVDEVVIDSLIDDGIDEGLWQCCARLRTMRASRRLNKVSWVFRANKKPVKIHYWDTIEFSPLTERFSHRLPLRYKMQATKWPQPNYLTRQTDNAGRKANEPIEVRASDLWFFVIKLAGENAMLWKRNW